MNKPLLVGIALVVAVVAVGVAIGAAVTARLAAQHAGALSVEIERQKQACAALEKSVATLEAQMADARGMAWKAVAATETHGTRLDALEKKDPFAALKKQDADRVYEQLKRDVDELKRKAGK